MTDVLTQVLDVLRIQTTLFAMRDLPSPWGVEFPQSAGAYIHVISGGEAWLQSGRASSRRLGSGDTVMLAHGTAHRLTGTPDGSALVAFDATSWKPNQLVALGTGADSPDGGTSGCTLVCGVVEMHQAASQPLLALLPEILVVSRDDPGAEDLELTLRLLRHETRASSPGSQTMLARLGDVLLLQLVRRWLEREDADHLGWFGGLQDRQIGAALEAMHADPAAGWTVETLAREASLSRSRFAQQFTARVGQAPMSYLTAWRLTLAAHLLREGQGIREVSRAVGYLSEPAFSRAFARQHGIPPSRSRSSGYLR
jgi:AraC-like DNA-binding protein